MSKLFFFVLLLPCLIKAQEAKVFLDANLELILNNKIEFGFGKPDLEPTKAFGFTTSINYLVFKKISIGLATGYKSYKQPDDFQMIELGGTIRYFFSDTDYPSVFVSITEEISLKKEAFQDGFNARLGITYPILKLEKMNVNFTVFKEMNILNLGKSKSYTTNTNIDFRATGVSLGAKF